MRDPLPFRSASIFLAAAASLTLALSPSGAAEEGEDEGFVPIFDGKSLEGWDGDPALWSVEDGAIVGRTTADAPIPDNTFIIWRAGELDDFELELEYRIEDGNSGIQVRSFEVPDKKWRVGGYQADIDSSGRYTGIVYGELFRGILAERGQKTVINEDGKPEVRETIGDADELGAKVKADDWNAYRIVAKGHTISQFINGQLMAEVTDEDTDQRRRKGILAFQLHAGPPMTVRFRDIRLKRLPLEDVKKVVFVAGNPSHGWGSHEHNAGCLLLAGALEENFADAVLTTTYRNGWPADPTALQNADALVMYCDGGGGHMANWHLRQINEAADRGLGVGCIHYAVEVPKGDSGDAFLKWIGGYFETDWSVNPHWKAEFESFPDHPVSRGVQPFAMQDEWYYHMRFREGMRGVTPILTDLPPDNTLNRPDGPHSGNPHVRKAVADGEAQHVMWVAERDNGGRGFGFTGGHFHRNWGDDNFRKVVLNAVAWIAGAEVPPDGVSSPTPTEADLDANQDEPKPASNG